MATEFKLPELGENVDAADVTEVLVKPGDVLTEGTSVIELETDKASVEVPFEGNGKVVEVKVNAGDKVSVGNVIFTYEQDAEAEEADNDEKEIEKAVEEKKAEHKEIKESVGATESNSAEVEFKLPELGENIESAQVTNVMVSSGDTVEKDQSVLELETDKASMELPIDISGKVMTVYVENGSNVSVGQPIFKILTGGADAAPAKETPAKPEVAEAPKETPKVAPAPKQESAPEIVKTDVPGVQHELQDVKPEKSDARVPRRSEMPAKIAPASPSVRRFAREIGIDINQVSGSGKRGRITVEDVKAFAKRINEQITKGVAPSGDVAPVIGMRREQLPDFSKFGETETEKMSKIRSVTANHLSYAWQAIPHVTQFDKADITELEKVRKKLGARVQTEGGKLTVTAILIKILAIALKKFPQFNASVDMDKKEIIYKKYFNVGVAVDTDRGLLVPVIKNVDKKNITELSVELGEISKKARDKKLTLEDMSGGNISISNLGGIGGTAFTPIVNSPEVAILGVSRGGFEPVFIDGEFQPRLMLPLSLSYDHRIIDGADGARFIRFISESLENPFLLSLEG